jgi:hypothetical protein
MKRKFVWGDRSITGCRLLDVSDPITHPKGVPVSTIYVPSTFRPTIQASLPPPPPPSSPPPPPPSYSPTDIERTETEEEEYPEHEDSTEPDEPSPKRHRSGTHSPVPCVLRVGHGNNDHILCLPEAATEAEVGFILDVCPKVADQITNVRLVVGPGSCGCARHALSQSVINLSGVLTRLPRVMSLTTVTPERPLSPQEERTFDLHINAVSRLM